MTKNDEETIGVTTPSADEPSNDQFEWHGLLLKWNVSEKRFDNFEQRRDRWASALCYPNGRRWLATLNLAQYQALTIGVKDRDGDTPERSLYAAADALGAAIDKMRDRIGRAP
jgi:hypothetical protein